MKQSNSAANLQRGTVLVVTAVRIVPEGRQGGFDLHDLSEGDNFEKIILVILL